MNKKNKEELIKKIVIERIKTMSPSVKIALGSKSKGEFLTREKLLTEVKSNSEIGKKIIDIQWKYIQALKLGLI
ncbi:MAG: hypothetical protein ABIH53_00935 [archaeon]